MKPDRERLIALEQELLGINEPEAYDYLLPTFRPGKFPKTWTEKDRRDYQVVRNYYQSTGNLNVNFEGVSSVVVACALRDHRNEVA